MISLGSCHVKKNSPAVAVRQAWVAAIAQGLGVATEQGWGVAMTQGLAAII